MPCATRRVNRSVGARGATVAPRPRRAHRVAPRADAL